VKTSIDISREQGTGNREQGTGNREQREEDRNIFLLTPNS
jgi:hypothetical protein